MTYIPDFSFWAVLVTSSFLSGFSSGFVGVGAGIALIVIWKLAENVLSIDLGDGDLATSSRRLLAFSSILSLCQYPFSIYEMSKAEEKYYRLDLIVYTFIGINGLTWLGTFFAASFNQQALLIVLGAALMAISIWQFVHQSLLNRKVDDEIVKLRQVAELLHHLETQTYEQNGIYLTYNNDTHQFDQSSVPVAHHLVEDEGRGDDGVQNAENDRETMDNTKFNETSFPITTTTPTHPTAQSSSVSLTTLSANTSPHNSAITHHSQPASSHSTAYTGSQHSGINIVTSYRVGYHPQQQQQRGNDDDQYQIDVNNNSGNNANNNSGHRTPSNKARSSNTTHNAGKYPDNDDDDDDENDNNSRRGKYSRVKGPSSQSNTLLPSHSTLSTSDNYYETSLDALGSTDCAMGQNITQNDTNGSKKRNFQNVQNSSNLQKENLSNLQKNENTANTPRDPKGAILSPPKAVRIDSHAITHTYTNLTNSMYNSPGVEMSEEYDDERKEVQGYHHPIRQRAADHNHDPNHDEAKKEPYVPKTLKEVFANSIEDWRSMIFGVIVGCISGLIGGLWGINSPPLTVYFSYLNLTGTTIRDTCLFIYCLNLPCLLAARIIFKIYRWDEWLIYLCVAPITIGGLKLGLMLHDKVAHQQRLILSSIQIMIFMSAIPLVKPYPIFPQLSAQGIVFSLAFLTAFLLLGVYIVWRKRRNHSIREMTTALYYQELDEILTKGVTVVEAIEFDPIPQHQGGEIANGVNNNNNNSNHSDDHPSTQLPPTPPISSTKQTATALPEGHNISNVNTMSSLAGVPRIVSFIVTNPHNPHTSPTLSSLRSTPFLQPVHISTPILQQGNTPHTPRNQTSPLLDLDNMIISSSQPQSPDHSYVMSVYNSNNSIKDNKLGKDISNVKDNSTVTIDSNSLQYYPQSTTGGGSSSNSLYNHMDVILKPLPGLPPPQVDYNFPNSKGKNNKEQSCVELLKSTAQIPSFQIPSRAILLHDAGALTADEIEMITPDSLQHSISMVLTMTASKLHQHNQQPYYLNQQLKQPQYPMPPLSSSVNNNNGSVGEGNNSSGFGPMSSSPHQYTLSSSPNQYTMSSSPTTHQTQYPIPPSPIQQGQNYSYTPQFRPLNQFKQGQLTPSNQQLQAQTQLISPRQQPQLSLPFQPLSVTNPSYIPTTPKLSLNSNPADDSVDPSTPSTNKAPFFPQQRPEGEGGSGDGLFLKHANSYHSLQQKMDNTSLSSNNSGDFGSYHVDLQGGGNENISNQDINNENNYHSLQQQHGNNAAVNPTTKTSFILKNNASSGSNEGYNTPMNGGVFLLDNDEKNNDQNGQNDQKKKENENNNPPTTHADPFNMDTNTLMNDTDPFNIPLNLTNHYSTSPLQSGNAMSISVNKPQKQQLQPSSQQEQKQEQKQEEKNHNVSHTPLSSLLTPPHVLSTDRSPLHVNFKTVPPISPAIDLSIAPHNGAQFDLVDVYNDNSNDNNNNDESNNTNDNDTSSSSNTNDD